MPEYLAPGVYVEEIERGPRPIEGVPTSTAAFLGETERGPLRPRLVTSYNEYKRWFGGVFEKGRFMPYSVNGFFENGGKRLYVCRIVGKDVPAATKTIGDFEFNANGPGAWGKRVWVRILKGSTEDSNKKTGFRLRFAYWQEDIEAFDPIEDRKKLPRPQYVEDYDDLSANPKSPDYFEKRLTDINTQLPITVLASIKRINAAETNPEPTTGEVLVYDGPDPPAILSSEDFKGVPDGARQERQGLSALELDPFRDIALVHAPYPPDDADDVNGEIITHCENQRYRFAVIDSGQSEVPTDVIPRGKRDSQYAAIYVPWIKISDPSTGNPTLAPPGGHVLGIYARTDTERGVFKAPANEVVRGAVDVRFDITERHQEILNPRGVNAIRRFPERGIRVWGARTISSNGLWKYVSVRRLFIFLERSIYEGTQWVVFEPNDDRLWARVKDTIRLFLRTQWRNGALFGRTEDEAFFITCDRTTMTQDDILNGRLICEIGIAPVRPAEFVIFRVFQQTAEAQR